MDVVESGSESAKSRSSSVSRRGRGRAKRKRSHQAARDTSRAKVAAMNGATGAPEPVAEETLSSLEVPPPAAVAPTAVAPDAAARTAAEVAAVQPLLPLPTPPKPRHQPLQLKSPLEQRS